MMFISEIYESRQGEGRWTGTPSVFIRTSGCNLRCRFCDTPFTSWRPEGFKLSLSEIIQKIKSYSAKHAVITGGEPAIAPELPELCSRLKDIGYYITIETAGTLDVDLLCDLMSISPKLSNSSPDRRTYPEWFQRHEQARGRPDVVQSLIRKYDYQLKFVVGSIADALEALDYTSMLQGVLPDRILMMPEGTSVEAIDQVECWLEPWCREHQVSYCDRAHIRWYGHQRGT